jgi:hypothetical protein
MVRGWFPQLYDTKLVRPSWGDIAKHHEYIADLVGVVPVSVIHQRLADEAALEVSVASLQRYVRARFAEDVRRGKVVIWRPPGEPGDDACGSRASRKLRAVHFTLCAGPKRDCRFRCMKKSLTKTCVRLQVITFSPLIPGIDEHDSPRVPFITVCNFVAAAQRLAQPLLVNLRRLTDENHRVAPTAR